MVFDQTAMLMPGGATDCGAATTELLVNAGSPGLALGASNLLGSGRGLCLARRERDHQPDLNGEVIRLNEAIQMRARSKTEYS